MFLVSHPLGYRALVIRELLRKQPSIALVVAAAYFEWTLSRALVALSERPNRELREALENIYGLAHYRDFWWSELQHLSEHQRLTEVIRNWHAVTQAFQQRNRLVHGRDRHTRNMATPHVECLLAAVNDLREYAQSHGFDLDRRLPVRKKRKEPPITPAVSRKTLSRSTSQNGNSQ